MYNSSILEGPNTLTVKTKQPNLTVGILFDPEVCGNLTEEYTRVRTVTI